MIVLDTHVLVWALGGDASLGKKARRSIQSSADKNEVLVAAITPWEIAMLVEKQRLSIDKDVGEWIEEALSLPGINIAPLEPSISVDSVRLPGTFNNDPADRMIVATARHFGSKLLTADRDILAYSEAGHVKAMDARQ